MGIFFRKFRVVSFCYGLLRNSSVCFGCFDIGSKHRNKPKFFVFGFTKQTETNAKQILFRFVSVRTEIYFCLLRGHPLSSFAAPDAGGVGLNRLFYRVGLRIQYIQMRTCTRRWKRKRSDSESVSGSGSSSFSFRGSDYGNSSGSTAGGRQSRGFYAPQLRGQHRDRSWPRW